LRELGAITQLHGDFNRGFFYNVILPAETFVAHGDRLLRTTPVCELKLSAPGTAGRKLAECPHLARIGNLFLEGDPPLSRADLRALLESPHAANLHTLHLPNLSDEELTDLAATTATGLRSLSISGAQITGTTLPAVLSRLGRLEDLSLCCEAFDPKNIAALNSPRLRKLSFGGTPVGATGMRALAKARELTGLKVLCFDHAGLNAEALEALATATHIRPEELWLYDDRLTTRGGAALASWPGLASVRTLISYESGLAGGGVAALARSPHLGALKKLTLDGNRVTDVGAEALAQSDGLSELVELDLGHNKITDRGVRALASARFPRLRSLDVKNNLSGEEGGKALLAAEHFNELRSLQVGKVSDSLRGQLLNRFPELHEFGAEPYYFEHGPELQAIRAELAATSG
ncbi:MAG: hypothetical protein K2V38_27895, partial [Gemmataceae bacterium]|nr:hypothetical protein [Gemmataceae bacterium]